MAVAGLEPAVNVLSGGFGKIATYAWVLIPIVVIFGAIGIVWWIKKIKNKKSQWSHTLLISRVLSNGTVTKEVAHKMRRFPVIKRADVFELEKPVLGGYLFPELAEYTGNNEFSIVLDTNNRIYINNGSFWNPDKSCLMVSAKHASIDISRADLQADFQNINKTSKRIEWSEIAKYAFMLMAILCLTIVGIVGIQKWGEAQQWKTTEAQAIASTMENMALAMETIEATVNTQKLEILPMMREIYKTKNIQGIINEEINSS